MRILHLLASDKFSGAENVACQIIKMFEKDVGVDMAYCSPAGEIENILKNKKIEYIPLKGLSVKNLKFAIKRYRPDIIHAHDMKASFIASLSCGKVKLVSHIHNNNYNSRKLSLKSILYCFAAKKSQKIIWVSNSSFYGFVFHKKFENKSKILNNVIDINLLREKIKQDNARYNYDIIYIGRLTEQKDPFRLLRVLQIVKNKRPFVKIAIIGKGELENELKAYSEELGLQNNVCFLGFMENPSKILADSKVMVLTSKWEGMPMVVLEALALNIPIISTPADGICDLVKNDINGFLSNDDNELAQKIIETLDKKKKELIYDIKADKSQIIDMENYKRKICKIYHNVIEKS